MKKLYFTVTILALLGFYGCIEQKKNSSKLMPIQSSDVNNVEVEDMNNVKFEFPKFLAGVWESDKFHWAFKFEPNGKISKLIHTIGVPIKVEEGMYYSENPDMNSSGLFLLGPCDAKYNPKTDVLKVSIVLDYFRIEIPTGVLEGNSVDIFEGPVSEKALTWNADWRNYSGLVGGSAPDINAVNENPEKLVFKKLELPADTNKFEH